MEPGKLEVLGEGPGHLCGLRGLCLPFLIIIDKQVMGKGDDVIIRLLPAEFSLLV